MKGPIRLILVVAAGVALGGGGSYLTMRLAPRPASAKVTAPAVAPKTTYVDAGKLLTPMVRADGHLAGYSVISFQLCVGEGDLAKVTEDLPLLLDRINLHTFQSQLAAGQDGALLDVAQFRRVAAAAAIEAYGKNKVRQIAVTGVAPA